MNWLKKWRQGSVGTSLTHWFRNKKLIPSLAVCKFSRGATICAAGDPCPGVFLVLSGKCEILRLEPGGRHKCIAVRSAGMTFGYWEVINDSKCRHTVRAVEPCVLLKLNAKDLDRLFSRKPDLLKQISEATEKRWKQTPEQIDSLPPHFGRVVFVTSLDDEVPDQLISEALCLCLHEECPGKVLMVEWSDKDRRALTLPGWSRRKPEDTGRNILEQHLILEEKTFPKVKIRMSENPKDLENLSSLLCYLGLQYPYVILRAAKGTAAPLLLECMVKADLAFVLVRQEPESQYEFKLMKNQLRERIRRDPDYLTPVVYFAEGEEHQHSKSTARESLDTSELYWIHESPPLNGNGHTNGNGHGRKPFEDISLRRIAREISGRRIGLALSSGGAKSLAHIGVIQVLEENGIEVDMIAGSSMGAYIGALWGYGIDGNGLEKLARELEGRWAVAHLVDPVLPPRQGFIRGERIKKRVLRSIGHAHFGDLKRPVRIVATRLDSLEKVVFSRGEVVDAVHASVAVPGVCVPVTIGGVEYVDGGIADPVPVDVLREMGIEKVLAVNTLPTSTILRDWVERNEFAYDSCGKSSNPIWNFFNKHFNYFSDGNILSTLLRSVHCVQMRIATMSCENADLALSPLTCDAHWTDFSNPMKYIELGRRAAEERLTEIKALVERKEMHEERPSVRDKVGSAY